jgi:hypothetical protein
MLHMVKLVQERIRRDVGGIALAACLTDQVPSMSLALNTGWVSCPPHPHVLPLMFQAGPNITILPSGQCVPTHAHMYTHVYPSSWNPLPVRCLATYIHTCTYSHTCSHAPACISVYAEACVHGCMHTEPKQVCIIYVLPGYSTQRRRHNTQGIYIPTFKGRMESCILILFMYHRRHVIFAVAARGVSGMHFSKMIRTCFLTASQKRLILAVVGLHMAWALEFMHEHNILHLDSKLVADWSNVWSIDSLLKYEDYTRANTKRVRKGLTNKMIAES